jgi:hypothetical protein
MSEFSTFLFASPTFFEGAGRLVDFGNTLCEYNVSETEIASDWRALTADCMAVAFPFTELVGETHCVALKGNQAAQSRD